MSILDRLQPDRHLDDAAMLELWTEARLAGVPASHPHVASCGACRSRYAALNAWADGLRDDARAEADDIFTTERLVAQHTQIFRRLEAMERPARVIAFPRLPRTATAGRSSAQRWIGAAAAAGLFVGLAAGQFMDLRWLGGAGSQAPTQTARTATPAAPASDSLTDEDLFYSPGDRPSARALEAIDALTPRSRDLDLPR